MTSDRSGTSSGRSGATGAGRGASERATEPDERTAVWILVTALSLGGAERTIIELVNGLDRDRFDVKVWTIFNTNPLAERLDDDVRLRTLGVAATHGDRKYEITGAVNPLMYVVAPLRFVSAVRWGRPDILHSFLFYDNIIARIAGLVTPGTAVVTGERGFHNTLRFAFRVLDRLTLGLSDVIVSNSRAGAQYYADRGFPRDRLRVVPNGRDLSAYRDAAADGVRDEFDVPAGVALAGTVGRLVEQKGYPELLRAWSRFVDAGADAHLLVVGWGPERDAFEELSADLGIAERVHFTGARDDVPELLDAMDLFVFPSRGEGLPGALQEAMAAGLPVVATRVAGTVELVTDGDTGLLVAPRDPAALASGIERLLSDRELARRLGERAQAVAFERYTRERMVDEFQALYADLA